MLSRYEGRQHIGVGSQLHDGIFGAFCFDIAVQKLDVQLGCLRDGGRKFLRTGLGLSRNGRIRIEDQFVEFV